jgi:pimeloyl-ACP methyl ester carboxylesterase
MCGVSPRNRSEKPWWLLVQIVLPILGVVWLIQGAYAIHREALPQRTVMLVAGTCHMPMTILDPPTGAETLGSAVVLHGLSANRRIMLYLGQNLTNAGVRVYIPDLPGHGDNTDPFSFARAEQCAAAAVATLIRSNQINPKTTILVGHSMGAAIAIRLADHNPVAATIAVSPAPLVMPQRMPANLLVLDAQFDIGAVHREAEAISNAAGINRAAPGDFAQDRAFHLESIPHATHTSVLFDPAVLGESTEWINQTLSGNFQRNGIANPEMSSMGHVFQIYAGALTGSASGLLGIFALFLPFVAIAGRIGGPMREESAATLRVSRSLALAEVAFCALAGVLLLKLLVPLKFLHIYAGDYVASLLLVVGVMLLALNWRVAKATWSPSARHLIPAAILAFATFLAIGAWSNWQLSDMWMNGPRWLRFAALLPFLYIFSFAEEIALGPVRAGKSRALRFAVFLALRAEIWLACLLAYFELSSGQVLPILLVAFFALFSILQRLATDAFRRRTGSPEAAALFGAILASWFIAAVLPLT